MRLTWQPLSMLKWQLYAAQTMKNQWAQGGALGSMLYGETQGDGLDEDQDSLKEAMIDTNPYLLGITLIVSIVHSVFEFLAFKNGTRSFSFYCFTTLLNESNDISRLQIFSSGRIASHWKVCRYVRSSSTFSSR